MKIRSLLFISLLLSCLQVFAVSATTLPQAFSEQEMCAQIARYINAYRAQQGLAPLRMNPLLSAAARQHSLEMAKHRIVFGHGGFTKRMQGLFKTIPGAVSGGENVAFNYRNAKRVSAGWIKSRPHRHNIEGHYNLTGIGVVKDDQGRLYFTQLFLRNGP